MKKLYLFVPFLLLVLIVSAQDKNLAKQKFHISGNLEQIPLWPGKLPDGPGPQGQEKITDDGSVTNVSNPRMIVHKPDQPNGTAILVISGGGYAHIELGKESTTTANWLQAQGVTAFELVYRLPQEGWKTTDVTFEDAQRAMRLIRSMTIKYDLDTNKIGILGFSAGGHLAGITAVLPSKQFYTPVDSIDYLSSKPNFAAMIYPVLTMLPPFNKTHAKKSILGEHPTVSEETAYSVEKQVTKNTPKTFLAQALDDPIAPVDNTIMMFTALRKVNVPSEIHTFQAGGHGWGMGKPGTLVANWPVLFQSWAKFNGFWR